jgi:hypothetical protein
MVLYGVRQVKSHQDPAFADLQITQHAQFQYSRGPAEGQNPKTEARLKTTTGMVVFQYTTIPARAANGIYEINGLTQTHGSTSMRGMVGVPAPTPPKPPLADLFTQFIGSMTCFYQQSWSLNVTWITFVARFRRLRERRKIGRTVE